ncbi:hypothetical protein IFM89_015403 [Coptis chinensis]|uniref:non-specific serine/threonine protein kinase n=1 Tax=Coptis chinensis TaxID=261450 RepID=A0A835MF64_9MAGN|nr:hypothetical protein IFM89_015403 [Coptis chinensis]
MLNQWNYLHCFFDYLQLLKLQIADVWSCGATLYVMLFGAYPFEDPLDPINVRKTIERIIGVQYSIPDDVQVSSDCRLLISQIFVSDPLKVIFFPLTVRLLIYILSPCLQSFHLLCICLSLLILQRITIQEIKKHPWFLKNLPRELIEAEKCNYEKLYSCEPTQSIEEIKRIIQEARIPAEGSKPGWQSMEST